VPRSTVFAIVKSGLNGFCYWIYFIGNLGIKMVVSTTIEDGKQGNKQGQGKQPQ
jgi:hypothetical protein